MSGRELWERVDLSYVMGPPKTIPPRERPKKNRIRDPNEKRKIPTFVKTNTSGQSHSNVSGGQLRTNVHLSGMTLHSTVQDFHSIANIGSFNSQSTMGFYSTTVGGFSYFTGMSAKSTMEGISHNVGGKRGRTLGGVGGDTVGDGVRPSGVVPCMMRGVAYDLHEYALLVQLPHEDFNLRPPDLPELWGSAGHHKQVPRPLIEQYTVPKIEGYVEDATKMYIRITPGAKKVDVWRN
ncbi:hypothetical protein QJS10_CPB12g00857 [Acorus calamus]|uniref:Uncharacterized protein n=1 Tax=Acorus calamus TaxID=4465 RepID=A0AAV9DNR4_ACOCL|nr:hypothetical protein QJS10_CPB12g00857 [Acorus calamus]